MKPSEQDAVQPGLVDPLIAALEQLAARLGADGGRWTLEAIFEDGRYVSGFAKLGPIDRRSLAALASRAA